MKIKKIYKGMHYCLSFFNFKPLFGQKDYNVKYKVSFDNSCAYNIGDDQSDVNKLFGISYGFHHNQSDRIGWRYIPTENKRENIEIVLYCYENKKRITLPICKVSIGDVFNIELKTEVRNGYRRICVKILNKNMTLIKNHTNQKHSWGYTLGAYFGGNKTAPHTMKIMIQQLL